MKNHKIFGIVSLTVSVFCALTVFLLAAFISLRAISKSSVILDGKRISPSALKKYESALIDESLYYYKSKLNDQEAFCFSLFSYALENGIREIEIPAYLLKDECDINKALLYFKCDNPLAEKSLGCNITSESDSGYIKLFFPAFTPESLGRKKKAYQKACSIIAAVPPDLTEKSDIANFLYIYLVKNVRYRKDESVLSASPEALYDCLINGETDSQGFSDALGMLFNLSGIQCFEVYTESSARNIAKIGNKYYNFDAASDSSIMSCGINISPLFCKVSDKFLSGGESIAGGLKKDAPLCTDESNDFKSYDFVLCRPDGKENDILKKMDKNLKIGKKHTVIGCDRDYSESEISKLADRIAEIKKKNIYYYFEPEIKTLIFSYNY